MCAIQTLLWRCYVRLMCVMWRSWCLAVAKIARSYGCRSEYMLLYNYAMETMYCMRWLYAPAQLQCHI